MLIQPKRDIKMRFLLISLLLITTLQGTAQVRDIKSKVKEDKSKGVTSGRSYSGSTAYWEPPELEDGLAEFLVGRLFYYTAYGVYRAADYGQSKMQNRRFEYPETFSFESGVVSGFDFNSNTFLTSPSARINWGLFASDLRYQYTHDVTDALHVIDWQVLKLRFPIQNLKIEYGAGFSHVFDPSKTYFEQSVGFDWCLLDRKANLQGEYRWTQTTSIGERFRKEAGVMVDYEIKKINQLGFCPSMGFKYQNFFESTRFRFVQLGLKIRVY
jgi:hypothetical protein